MQWLEHLRDDNNLHCLSFNLYLKRTLSFIRPKVYAKFLGYFYAYFFNSGKYYIGTTVNNQGVIKHKNIFFKDNVTQIIADFIFIASPYFT